MRGVLSQSLVDQSNSDDSFIVLSGDHGYALFDALRKSNPNQFVNVGIIAGFRAYLVAILSSL